MNQPAPEEVVCLSRAQWHLTTSVTFELSLLSLHMSKGDSNKFENYMSKSFAIHFIILLHCITERNQCCLHRQRGHERLSYINGNRPLLLLDRLQPRLQYSHLVACMHLSLLIALKSRWILWMTLFVICHTYVVAGIHQPQCVLWECRSSSPWWGWWHIMPPFLLLGECLDINCFIYFHLLQLSEFCH